MVLGRPIILAATAGLSFMFSALQTGCATSPGGGTNTSTGQTVVNQLAARQLQDAECGLFVWTADAAKRFILFSQAQDNMAIWFDGVGEESLAVTSKAGNASQGQYPQQVLITPSGAQLTLRLDAAEPMAGGMRYKAGTLVVKQDDSWDKVIPVVGLAGCHSVAP